MNRREALQALMALPAVTRISTVPTHSDDVLVVECERDLTTDAIEDLRVRLQQIWPHRQIVVLGPHIRLKVAPR